ncbi:MAG: ATP phosphoribosyltransferase regulatory subunit [Oscillospiraceae bacterium]|nr:ATP phosphoribosyltransferase regulatory subunit [Oscillospiraceae bacterium]
MNYIVNTPEGTRDRLFGECRERRLVQSALTHLFRQRGFAEVITPEVEFYDLFHQTNNTIPQEQMLKIIDRSGKIVVLRPDCTTPIARVAATKLKDSVRPQRLYYNQMVYRSGAAHLGDSTEIAQCGVEILGAGGLKPELEAIALAVDSLRACGLERFHVEIGHAGFYQEIISKMDITESAAEQVRACVAGKNYAALNRLLEEYREQPACDILRRISRMYGGVEVLDEAEALSGGSETISYLRELYSLLEKAGYGSFLRFDLGMVSHMDYYTGVIFHGYVEGAANEVVSGGRYDNLVSNFGREAHAIGFAVNVDAVARCLPPVELPVPEAVVHFAPEYLRDALNLIDSHPAGAWQLSPCNRVESSLNLAREKGIGKVIVVDENGQRELEVTDHA